MPKELTLSPMQVVALVNIPTYIPPLSCRWYFQESQTVPKDCSSGIRQLLEEWHKRTGCPMLLNTSLNIRGESHG